MTSTCHEPPEMRPARKNHAILPPSTAAQKPDDISAIVFSEILSSTPIGASHVATACSSPVMQQSETHSAKRMKAIRQPCTGPPVPLDGVLLSLRACVAGGCRDELLSSPSSPWRSSSPSSLGPLGGGVGGSACTSGITGNTVAAMKRNVAVGLELTANTTGLRARDTDHETGAVQARLSGCGTASRDNPSRGRAEARG